MLLPSTQSFYTLSLLISTWGLVQAAPVPQKTPSYTLEPRDINVDLSMIERRDIEPVQLERRTPPRSNGPPGTNHRIDAARGTSRTAIPPLTPLEKAMKKFSQQAVQPHPASTDDEYDG